MHITWDGFSPPLLPGLTWVQAGRLNAVLGRVSPKSRQSSFQPLVPLNMLCSLRCRPGFIGVLCQYQDPCHPSPCLNGAACKSQVVSGRPQHFCVCQRGFRGTQQPLSACLRKYLMTRDAVLRAAGQDCSLIDACATSPCANGARCVNWNNRYNCSCPPGFHGKNCRIDIDECQKPGQCLNGGACVNKAGSYDCQCPAGYSGRSCEVSSLPCAPSQCLNGGTCRQTSERSYECTCLPGFVGHNCEVNVDDCPGHKCMNGGICVDGVNTYNCQCLPEWTGQYCAEDVNECLMQPNACHNGGTCFNTNGGHTCVCVNGWTGDDCSENIDDCAIAVCFNGATCHDRVASFFCECPVGKTGLLCHLDDACVSNPCNEGAVCDTNPLNGRAICTCPAGFVGGACNQDMDECSIGANPCEHFGKCVNTEGSFLCQCARGYTGPRCEIDINECLSGPCQNDATCLDRIGEFTCICMPGFTGTMCQIDIDECASTPCKNGAKCFDRPNGYECRCAEGRNRCVCVFPLSRMCFSALKCIYMVILWFEGTLCESNIDNCQPDPCHHGTCVDGIASYTCNCDPGYTGYRCENQLNECHSNPCQNGGKCVDLVNKYICQCRHGTSGTNCEINFDDCASNPCDYGICKDGINRYDCVCKPGFTGPLCRVKIDECASNPCRNGGTCIDEENGFRCHCPEGFHDPLCYSEVDECSSSPCVHGTCRDDLNGYRCDCEPGWVGPNCDVDRNDCQSSPCQHGGTCIDQLNGFTCMCQLGFRGANCEIDINDCLPSEYTIYSPDTNLLFPVVMDCLPVSPSPDPCLRGGSCMDGINSFTCSCLPGFTGPRCTVEADECQSSPCLNGGSCTDYVNSYTCSCKPGFTGIHCETNIPDCTESAPARSRRKINLFLNACSSCFNGGTCIDKVNGYSCTCRSGFTGSNCQYEVNECDTRPCLNGGVCQDGLEAFHCTCPKGYTGNRCQVVVDWCRLSNPCKNGGRCRKQDASFTCDCTGGWSGRYCDIPGVSCEVAAVQRGLRIDQLCHHGGHCVNTGNTHYCKCPTDYTGSYCESQVDHCEDKPCRNGATCRAYVGGYTCECMPGYQGMDCEIEINECQSHPCQNGGSCIDLVGRYICSCPPGTLGVLCEINEDDCSSSPRARGAPKCLNNGTCVDQVGGYRCNCPPGFTGERCEGDINECRPNPCSPSNSLDCIQLPNGYQCVCKPGFTGRRCQSRFSVCESQPCQNGGACSPSPSTPLGYSCNCQSGYTGSNCERSLVSCRELSCYNGGSCVLTLRGPRCTCLQGFAGPDCQQRSPDGCSSQPCRNGGICLEDSSFPFFRCQCPSGQMGKRCELTEQKPVCPLADCQRKAKDGFCDKECNTFLCEWDGGDCSLAVNPWAKCNDLQCWRVFNNSQCDEACNHADCLYDNFDCNGRVRTCNPIYEAYCIDHYGDGRCDQGCNTEECGWDGLDCAENVPEDLADGVLVIVVLLPPEELLQTGTAFLQRLSAILRTTLRFRLDRNGEAMIRPYTRLDARLKRELGSQLEVIGSIVYLEIDNRLCAQGSNGCFPTADSAAEYLGALSAVEMLPLPYPIKQVRSEYELSTHPLLLIGVAALFLLVILVLGMLIARRKREHSTLWFPEGFLLKKETSINKSRREPVGQDALGMKHMPKAVEESLLGDHSDQWLDTDCPEAKRLKVEEPSVMSDSEDAVDCRRWTQHHLAAADIRMPPSMALTPPQGEFDNDCMDVNVRGPDGFTPLMLASFCGGGLEPDVAEDEDSEESSANIISDLIYQGASLAAQTDRTGETALHLAARYARADAAKRLLDAGADANAQDNTGRTPLHAAVAADAQGVFQILIRNRATDLDSRMYDGSTALILAARLAVEGMVEELIACHADVNAVDELGKSALHWAAAVNNVEATVALLKNGANKDMQDLKEETPLFLAAREGSCEAVRILLAHFANREITDHMDRLPRDIAQERMHHDIVQLLDEYNTVRSPQGQHTLSPLMCPPGAFAPSLKQTPQGKKGRRPPGTKGSGLGGLQGGLKESAKSRNRKLTLDMQSSLLESSVTLSPVDSLDSPRGGASNGGYVTNPASPAAMPSPGLFHPSVSMPATPMVHGMLETGGPFAVPMAQMGDLGDGALSMGRVPMPPGAQGSSGYVLNTSQLGLNLGMVSPVSVPYDWHTRMPTTTQCGQQIVGLAHPSVNTQASMASQGPTLQQQQQQQHQQQQHNLLLQQQRMFHGSQQPLLQPTPVSTPQSLSPVKLPSIAEHHTMASQQSLACMGTSTPPATQQAQPAPPPPPFFKQQAPQVQAPTSQPEQAQTQPSQPSQAPPPQQPSSSGAGPEDYPTPPSQHSYSSALDATPKHYLHLPSEHPYLTPSPESPEAWSSPSPHCVSDWSDSTPSPAVAGPAQTQIPHVPESSNKMQVFA
uniref:Notch receptor 3 n=1 Tax=Scleropages formosus TaxID=113540 RepID=A0A8C9UBQ6_SCLFO